ncbi:hypothetical protein [Streptomyces cavernicola]|uniref:WXG100 family type VII secretion target n=1 Tax=Streptomyces cavernicola TaxID=3043613 RepID=A0ABT6SIB7_9ACTN|nr:hypothetical protein [Streptomyces sp. B-S-A6]MDI3407942.1 hypothetical protein [Streptomyces sp. B-S-A6]
MQKGSLNVEPSELRASAGAADGIGDDLQKPIDKAVNDARSAAVTMNKWSITAELDRVANDWGTALHDLRKSVGGEGGDSEAERLRRTADGHEFNEDLTAQSFRAV